MTGNPATHTWNVLLHSCCHEPTTILDYDRGLISKHAINREKNGQKCFRYSRKCLLLLSFFILPTEPGVVSLAPSCRCHIPSPLVWHQWWCQSEFIIIPGWGRLLSYLNRSSRDIPPTLICCGYGGWGFWCVHSQGRRLIMQSIEARNAPHYGVQWRALCFWS